MKTTTKKIPKIEVTEIIVPRFAPMRETGNETWGGGLRAESGTVSLVRIMMIYITNLHLDIITNKELFKKQKKTITKEQRKIYTEANDCFCNRGYVHKNTHRGAMSS